MVNTLALHDELERRKRGYGKGSIVYYDGREWLSPYDWKKRKKELFERAKGRCEHRHVFSGYLVRCRHEGTEPDHIVPRSKSHDDRLSNLQLLCHTHHVKKHPEKNKLHWRENGQKAQ